MRETIQRVLAAEDEARRLVEEARGEAEAWLADCRRRAAERIEAGRREARAAAAEIAAAAARAREQERAARLHAASEDLDARLRLPEAAAAEAVAALVAAVTGRGGP